MKPTKLNNMIIILSVFFFLLLLPTTLLAEGITQEQGKAHSYLGYLSPVDFEKKNAA